MYISVSLQHNAHLLFVLSSIFSLSSFWLSPIVVHLLFCLDVSLSSLRETLHSPVLMLSTSFLSFPLFFLLSLLYEEFEEPRGERRWNWILILLFYSLHKSEPRLFNKMYFCQVYHVLWDVFQPHYCCHSGWMEISFNVTRKEQKLLPSWTSFLLLSCLEVWWPLWYNEHKCARDHIFHDELCV